MPVYGPFPAIAESDPECAERGSSMAKDRDSQPLGAAAVRRADVEPYTALRWVGTLFKAAAVFLAVALLTEVVVGLQIDGLAALPELLGELARTVVVAVALWGVGDLVRLVIQVGHDVRAQRILLGRLTSRMAAPEPEPHREGKRTASGGRSGPPDLRIVRSDSSRSRAAGSGEDRLSQGGAAPPSPGQ